MAIDTGSEEWRLRKELAAAFRLAHYYGWAEGINNHITARLNEESFLMNPLGLGWHEIKASDLVKIHFSGEIVIPKDASLAPAGLNFHRAILNARPDVNATIHIHPKAGVVVSATRQGLMIVDQSGCELHDRVAYHEFKGIASKTEEAEQIVADLGTNMLMIMWNHGLLSVGSGVGEAFIWMMRLIAACELQVSLLATGAEIRHIPEAVLRKTAEKMHRRQGDAPAGQLEWVMNLRLAEQLDPTFRT